MVYIEYYRNICIIKIDYISNHIKMKKKEERIPIVNILKRNNEIKNLVIYVCTHHDFF